MRRIAASFFWWAIRLRNTVWTDIPYPPCWGMAAKTMEADVVATFLPGEVVESLYAAHAHLAGLQVASMTLEPIAAMNAAIPAELRLLNLALVDIGAGTTDIAVCRDRERGWLYHGDAGGR